MTAGLASPPADAVCAHELLVVDSDEQLRAAAAAHLRAGLAAGDAIRAVLPRWLVTELAPVLPDATLTAVEELRRPREPDVIAGLRRRAEELAPRRMRLVALVTGSDARDWEERCRCEAVTNLVYEGLPISVLCIYDRRTAPPAAVDAATATHPRLHAVGGCLPNPGFLDPRAFLAGRAVLDEPLQLTAPVLAVDDAASLPALRHALGHALRGLTGDPDAEEDFHLALSEMAANAFRHGTRPVSARLWASADRLVCTISDSGTSYGDPTAGYRPAHGADLSRGGMGLWLARKLCDHVDLIAGPSGFTVRLVSVLR